MTKLTRAKELLNRMLMRVSTAVVTAETKLKERRGDSNLVSIIFMVVVVIVVISVIFFPQLREMLTGVFDKSGDALNDIWNYS